jgi:hypothetical protein
MLWPLKKLLIKMIMDDFLFGDPLLEPKLPGQRAYELFCALKIIYGVQYLNPPITHDVNHIVFQGNFCSCSLFYYSDLNRELSNQGIEVAYRTVRSSGSCYAPFSYYG